MRVCLVSDLHFGVRKNSEVFLNSQTRFITEQLVPYLKSNGIEYLFVLGDVFDNRSSTNTKVMNAVHEVFKKHFSDFKVYVLVGNHDCYFNSSVEVNSLKFLDEFNNVTLIEKITNIEIDNKNIVMVPWIVDNVKFVREFSKRKCDVCFGHFNIKGFHFNKFKRSDDGLHSKLFGKCQKVFTGHFHIRNSQTLYGSDIVYIGSPYQLTRNDIDEKRGFTILDLSKMEHEFIDNEVSLKYIKLKFPEKFSKKKVNNNIVDVHISYDETYNENEIDKYVKKIEEYCPAMTPNIFVDNNSELNGVIDLENYNIGSMVDLMREYIDILDIGNKEEIYETLIDLYNEVKGDI